MFTLQARLGLHTFHYIPHCLSSPNPKKLSEFHDCLRYTIISTSLRRVHWFVRCHTASRYQGWDWNPSTLCPSLPSSLYFLLWKMSQQEPKGAKVRFGSLFQLQDTGCRSYCGKICGSELSTSTVKMQRKKMHARLTSPTSHRSGCPTQGTVSPIIKIFLPISINVCPEARLQGESRLCQVESEHSTLHSPSPENEPPAIIYSTQKILVHEMNVHRLVWPITMLRCWVFKDKGNLFLAWRD